MIAACCVMVPGNSAAIEIPPTAIGTSTITVQFAPQVLLNVATSLEPGGEGLQFSGSLHRAVRPPPTHVFVAAPAAPAHNANVRSSATGEGARTRWPHGDMR